MANEVQETGRGASPASAGTAEAPRAHLIVEGIETIEDAHRLTEEDLDLVIRALGWCLIQNGRELSEPQRSQFRRLIGVFTVVRETIMQEDE